MQYGINEAYKNGRKVIYRTIGKKWINQEIVIAKNHSHATIWGLNINDVSNLLD